MDAFVYLRSEVSQNLDQVEDAINSALGDAGEVIGTGTGLNGSNFDIEIRDDAIDATAAVDLLRHALARFGLRSAVIVVSGIEYPLTQ